MLRFFAGVASTLILISVGFLIFAVWGHPAGSERDQQFAFPAILIGVGGLLLAAITTIAGVYFGWRKDRREARLLQLQVEKLTFENAELESRLAKSGDRHPRDVNEAAPATGAAIGQGGRAVL